MTEETEKRILGLDIGGGNATAFLLDTGTIDGANFRDYIHSKLFNPFRVELSRESLENLVSLNPDIVVFEPTGDHYERVFTHWFKQYGIPYRRCVGSRVAAFRRDKGLMGKTDDIDSFSLALFGYYKLYRPGDQDFRAFLPECELEELRRWWLQRFGVVKRRAALVNRLRAQISAEFPEAKDSELKRDWGEESPGLIKWLCDCAEGRSKAIWDNSYHGGRCKRGGKRVIAPGTCGVGLSDYTRQVARLILDVDTMALDLERRCDRFLEDEKFKPYLAAFEAIGGSRLMVVIWLTRIYPFERFLVDGRPDIIKRDSKKGRPCTIDRSLSQFKAALGAGTVENTSGTRQKRANRQGNKWQRRRASKPGQNPKAEVAIGDRYSRQSFFLWAVNQVEPKTASCNETLKAQSLKLKERGQNLYQRLGNLQGYYCKLLYKELVKRLV